MLKNVCTCIFELNLNNSSTLSSFLAITARFFISCPFFRSKTNDLTSLEEKLRNQAKASKQETQKKQDDILAKEKQIQQLLERSKELERRVAEFTNARSVEEEKQANSLEELKVTLCLKI